MKIKNKNYNEITIYRVLKEYLYNGLSHRDIEEKILNITASDEYGGFDAMNILHEFEIDKEKKKTLKNKSLDEEIVNAKGNYRLALDLIKKYNYLNEQEGDINMKDIKDKNIILYGPPGTGKTYNSINYAIAIIEGKNIEEIRNEEYAEIIKRYNNYKENNQIIFTTFHQSYGYEEFIEGIKPVIEDELDEKEEKNSNIIYRIEDGVFKNICELASTVKVKVDDNLQIDESATVWKISLEGRGKTKTKAECFLENCIRIGWDNQDEFVTKESEFDSERDKYTVLYFQDEMKIGDIVLTLYDHNTIDGIGVVTGDYEYDNELEYYKRKRKVKWLAKDIKENVYKLNGQTHLPQRTLSELKRITPQDVIEILQKLSEGEESKNKVERLDKLENNKKKYVLIIDEINRGNISKIFGELITLIEESKRIGKPEGIKVTLPYSKKLFGVPENVYILGTMNTADRSIALLDTALRRRFKFIEIPPNSEILSGIEVDEINISEVFRRINERIEVLYDKEHKIGHSYFMKLKYEENRNLETLRGIFENAIIPLLQEYFYEDYEKIQLILGDNYKKRELQFIQANKIDNELFGAKNINIDFGEFTYSINKEAFSNVEAYKNIYKYKNSKE